MYNYTYKLYVHDEHYIDGDYDCITPRVHIITSTIIAYFNAQLYTHVQCHAYKHVPGVHCSSGGALDLSCSMNLDRNFQEKH